LQFGIRPENDLLERIDKNKNRYWKPAHERLPLPTEKEFARVPGLTANGFAKWESMALSKKSDTGHDIAIYVLPGEERLSHAEHPLVIKCYTFVVTRICNTKVMSHDGRVLLTPEWLEAKFPESSWKQLDESYRQLASHIFIDRNMGDFQ
jgi:hypothetical protein